MLRNILNGFVNVIERAACMHNGECCLESKKMSSGSGRCYATTKIDSKVQFNVFLCIFFSAADVVVVVVVVGVTTGAHVV